MAQNGQPQLERRGERALSRTSQVDPDRGLKDASLVSILGGGAILAYGVVGSTGITRLLLSGVGAGLLFRGISKTMESGGGLKRLLLHTQATKSVEVTTSITVERPPSEVYRYWRNVENLPRFLSHIDRVMEIEPGRTQWTANLPAGLRLEWEAELVEEHEEELLVWKSVEGSDIYNEGYVTFRPLLRGAATEVKARIIYRPPAGELGARVANFIARIPSQVIKEDLRSFKQLMETGETPTTAGQSSGRSGDGAARLDRML